MSGTALPGVPPNDDATSFALRAKALLVLDKARSAQIGQRWLSEILRLYAELETSGDAGRIDQTRSVYERLILLTEGWAGRSEVHHARAAVLVWAIERFGAAALVDGALAPRVWEDVFVAEQRLEAVARCLPHDREIQLERAKGAVNALSRYGDGARAASDPADAQRLWDRMAAAEGRLDAVARDFPDDREIELHRAEGAVNALSRYGNGARAAADAQPFWDRMAAAEGRLDAVARDFPDDREIQLERAKGAVNALSRYGDGARAASDPADAQPLWDRMAAAEGRLDAVTRDSPHDREIQLHRAGGAINALNRYGDGARAASNPADAQRLWDRMAAAEGRLDAVARDSPHDREIQLHRAGGAINALTRYGDGARAASNPADAQRLWDRMAAAEGRLDAVARDFPDDREIQLHRAMGVFNALTRYGDGARAASNPADAQRLWDRMAAAEGRLDAVARDFPDDREIQLARAKGAVNALTRYGDGARAASNPADAQRLWDRMAAAEGRLDAVARDFPDDREIQQVRAEGAINALRRYGLGARAASNPADAQALWDRMAAAEGRLDAVARDFPDDHEIQLARAKGAVNALAHYGDRARAASDPADAQALWDRMAAAEGRLDAVARDFPDDHEIQLARAQGAHNLMILYDASAAQTRELRHAARNALAKVARDFPNDQEIQDLASESSVTYVEQLVKGWPFGPPKE